MDPDSKKALDQLGEYVGANVPIEIDDDMMSLIYDYDPVSTYPVLYRIWLYLDTKKALKAIKETGSYKVNPAHSCTLSKEALQKMHDWDPGAYEGYPILCTIHRDLEGFSPIKVLKGGVRWLNNKGEQEDADWINEVIRVNEFQKEIYVLEPITEIKKENLYKIIWKDAPRD